MMESSRSLEKKNELKTKWNSRGDELAPKLGLHNIGMDVGRKKMQIRNQNVQTQDMNSSRRK